MRSIKSSALSRAARFLASPAVASSLLVLPFMILEFVNRRAFHEPSPIPLFGMMWGLAFTFVYLLTKTVERESFRGGSVHALARLLLGAMLLFFIAWAWVGIVVDQMPCFLGVQYCD